MIRAGLVGLGKMGLSHQAIINAHPDVELSAVCDASQYVLEVLNKYTGVETYTDYRKMIGKERLDCVIIATPSRLHGEMVRYALERDLHVFCEKPFSLDPREGRELVELAELKERVNQVGYHCRYVEAFREARRLLEVGVLGPVHHVRAEAYGPVVLRPSGSTWRSSKSEGGGCLNDYASHALDLVHWLVGVPEAVSGAVLNRIHSRDVDDEIYATLHFADGASGQLAANWSDESYRKMSTRITIWGRDGRLTVDRQECQIYLRRASTGADALPQGWTVRYTTDLTEPVWYYLRGEEYSRQIEHFVRGIQNRKASQLSSFATALATDRVIYAIRSSADGERGVPGRRVTIEPPGAASAESLKRRPGR